MARTAKEKNVLTPEEKLKQALVPKQEQPYKVPKNWCWVYLQNLCSIPITDGTHKTPTYCNKEEGIPFLSAKDVTSKKICWENIKYITQELHEELYKRLAPQLDDILLAKNGTTGVAAIVDTSETFDLYVTLALLRPNKDILFPLYMLNVINSPVCKSQFDNNLTGIGVPNLHLRDIKGTCIPLPPLPEQHRIVSRIESLFTKLDEAKEKAQAVVDGFEDRKAVILHKAFTGELTQCKDQISFVRVTELVKPEKNSLKAGPFGSALKKEMYVDKGYKIYGQEQVINGDENIGDYYISEKKFQELYACRVSPGDILISLVGTVGKVLVLSDNCQPGIINPRLIKVSIDKTKMEPYYFKYYFESGEVKSKYKADAHGTTMDVLNMSILKRIEFPLIPVTQQRIIIRLLDKVMQGEQHVMSSAEQVISQIDIMKKSILTKAFHGKLGTNDPSDESAEELLKRIL